MTKKEKYICNPVQKKYIQNQLYIPFYIMEETAALSQLEQEPKANGIKMYMGNVRQLSVIFTEGSKLQFSN